MSLYTYSDNSATTTQAGFVHLDSVGNQLFINQLDSRSKPVYYLNDTLNPKSLIFINQGSVSVQCETSEVITSNPNNQLVIDLLSIGDLGPLANSACTIDLQIAPKVEELSDTNIVSPVDGQVLQYSAGLWVNAGGGGGGGITSITAGTGLTATPVNPIVASGTLAITNTAVTAGSYTKANITVNAQGQLTAAANGSAGAGEIVANYGAFAAGQQATYSSTLNQWSNPPKSQLQFYYQYDSSETTTPAAGKFSIQSTTPPATVYFNNTTLDGVSVGGVLSQLPAQNYLTAITEPFGTLSFTGNGVVAGSVTAFECTGAAVGDYTNNAYVTLNFVPFNALYVDSNENISSNNKLIFGGSASSNTVYAANPSSSAIHTGNANTLIGQGAFAPTGTLANSNITAVGASALSNAVPVTGSNIVAVGTSAGVSTTGAASGLTMVGTSSGFAGASTNSVCVGNSSGSASAVTECVVIGVSATANANQNTVVGDGASANNDILNAVYGKDAQTTYARTVLIGAETNASANGGVAIGYQSQGNQSSSSDPNVSVGQESLETVSGGKNTCVGTASGQTVGTSGQNTFIGHNSGMTAGVPSNCTAVGAGSMQIYTASAQSTAFGVDTLKTCSGSGSNCCIGTGIMSATTTAQNNTCLGEFCAPIITSGSNNTIAGEEACSAMTTGFDNCVIGQNAFNTEQSGASCVVIGAQALENGNSGITASVFIGAQTCPSLQQTVSPSNMIVIGQGNMNNVTDCGSGIILVGSQSMSDVPSSANSAENCICIGNSSLSNNSGINTICVGTQSLGNGNHTETVAIGGQLLNTAGSSSTSSVLIGHQVQTTTASASNSNVIIGHESAPDLACAGHVIIGADACQAALSSTFTGLTDNIIIGSGADVGASGVSESILIGSGGSVNHTQAICLGSSCNSGADNSLNLNRVTVFGTATSGAAVLPATPQTFLQVFINTTEYRIPLYLP